MLEKMRALREQLDIRQRDLADYIGCTPQFISAIEREENVLSYEMARKIARYMDTTPDNLFLEDFRKRERERKRRQEEEGWD